MTVQTTSRAQSATMTVGIRGETSATTVATAVMSMSDKPTASEKIREILSGEVFPNPHDPAETVGDTIGDFAPIDTVELTEDSLEWLVGALGGRGELHAETVDLDTTEGTFTFSAEDGTVIVTYNDGKNDES